MKLHDHTKMQEIGCEDCYKNLSADPEGYLLFRGKYVVYVSHPSQLYQGDRSYNDRQRKKHLALSLEGKSLCNMLVQQGDKKLAWNSPMQYVREPSHGAGETCKSCWNNLSNSQSEQEG